MRLLDFIKQNAAFLSAGFLLTFGSAFGQTFFISLFAGEIRADFGLSHALWGQIYAIGTLASALVMVWSGALTDVFRIRALGAMILIGTAAACLVMAAAPVWWALIPAIFFLRFVGQGMMSHMGQVAMARWFVASRGKALSVASLGFSVAEAALPVLIVALLVWFDWRLIWVGCAVFALLLLPILQRLLRLERTPQDDSKSTQSLGLEARHWSRVEVLRHRLFWFMIPALLGPPAFNTAFFFQQVHYAETKGWTHLELVALFPLYTIVSVAAAFGTGFIIDRVGTRRLMPLYQFPMALGFIAFALAQTPWGAALGLILLAVGAGANNPLTSAFWAEFYGTRNIGAIKAMGAAIMVLGSAIGPGLTGSLITAGVGIEAQMLWIAGYFVLTCTAAGIGIASLRASAAAA
jgi:MFS family permease